MIYKENFSANLRRLRKENKLSLQALGDILKISNQAVSLLEMGKNAPSFDVLMATADFFDCSLDYLCGRSDTK